MEQILNLLAKADAELEHISVHGGDAYRMVNARTLLKAVYDALQKPTEEVTTEDG